jgi:tRNA modification GTPase
LSTDTILAIATAPGVAGVGIIRVSGPRAVEAVSPFFKAQDKRALAQQPARFLAFGRLVDAQGLRLDECMVVRFEAPHSFTGEDVVEVHAHGGTFHLKRLVQLFLEGGRALLPPVRMARPGEFTERAFLAGKIDLTRAEAVADLIHAGSDLSREAAARQLAGSLQQRIEDLRSAVLGLLAQAEAACDFPDDEDQLAPRQRQTVEVEDLLERLQRLLDTARTGRLVTQGVRVALLGAPNAGKSSLLNALLGEDRAIVSAEPGTTRDYLEARVAVEGFPIVLLDTAGLRQAVGSVEAEGVRRSLALGASADLRLLLLDSGAPFDAASLDAIAEGDGEVLFVLTKSDLPAAWDFTRLRAALRERGLRWGEGDQLPRRVLSVSARLSTGLDALMKRVLEIALDGRAAQMLEQVLLTQSRHERAVRAAHESLLRVREGLLSGATADLLAVDLRAALEHLGEIVGATARAEVLEEIFRRFCIGK